MWLLLKCGKSERVMTPIMDEVCVAVYMAGAYLFYLSEFDKGAMTCDFQKCGILTSVDSDEPVQPPFKLRNSK